MAKLTRKSLHEAAAPMAKAAHRAVKGYLVGEKFKPTPGFVASHRAETPKAGLVEWEGFTLEISAMRRSRVVRGVPTPFSLYTFTLCIKRDGKLLACGETLSEFLDRAMRVVAHYRGGVMTEERITSRYVRGWISREQFQAELVKLYDREDAKDRDINHDNKDKS